MDIQQISMSNTHTPTTGNSGAKQSLRGLVGIFRDLPAAVMQFISFVPFFFLIVLVLVSEPIRMLGRMRLVKPLASKLGPVLTVLYDKLALPLNRHVDGQIAPSDVVLLAMSHLRVKRVRSLITVGGMAIGFGSVIFLLSLGYGFQRLVISRVATLGEMKQIDVTTSQASALVFNSEVIDKILGFESVETVLPVISTVSKVTYNNSVSDVVAYGVTTRFLEESATKPMRGEIFTNEEYISDAGQDAQVSQAGTGGTVAGAMVETIPGASLGQELHQVQYAVFPQVWKPVYQSPSVDARIIGYTKRTTGQRSAREVWGSPYGRDQISLVGTDEQGNTYQTWVVDTVLVWKQQSCSMTEHDCVDGQYVVENGPSGQQRATGYMTEEDLSVTRYAGSVAGATTGGFAEGSVVQAISFSLGTTKYVATHTQPKASAQSVELFTKTEASNTTLKGHLVIGEYYYDEKAWGYVGVNGNGKRVGYWVRATVPLWKKLDCGENCDYYLTHVGEADQQVIATVYLRAADVQLVDLPSPPAAGSRAVGVGLVLGVSSDGMVLSETTASGSAAVATASTATQAGALDIAALGLTGADDLNDLDWALIASQAGIVQETQTKDTFPLPEGARKVALVNTAMLTLLGINPAEAMDKEFTSVFLLDGVLFNKQNYSAESEPATYKIIGILPDDRTPAFYVPLGDVKGVGITNYSQLKVIAADSEQVGQIREDTEALGFRTNSVVDTVASINSLFNYLRLGLLVLGLIALGVAALGMFNTLTVSLLEKTREVGLMKAMGMKSREVKQLFLAESVIMGVAGGFFGLLFGFTAGKLVSLVLTSVAIASGEGVLNVTHIPLALTLSILAFSFVVGILTGWYPAHRATKVSALNALRYE